MEVKSHPFDELALRHVTDSVLHLLLLLFIFYFLLPMKEGAATKNERRTIH